jgi:hypothetical protein
MPDYPRRLAPNPLGEVGKSAVRTAELRMILLHWICKLLDSEHGSSCAPVADSRKSGRERHTNRSSGQGRSVTCQQKPKFQLDGATRGREGAHGRGQLMEVAEILKRNRPRRRSAAPVMIEPGRPMINRIEREHVSHPRMRLRPA